MKKYIKIFIVLFMGFSLLTSFIQYDKKKKNVNNLIDLVPNEETAIKVAEAIWLPIYGDGIYEERPFKAELDNGIWIVEGSLPSGMMGGVLYIEIQKKDCKILKVSHGK